MTTGLIVTADNVTNIVMSVARRSHRCLSLCINFCSLRDQVVCYFGDALTVVLRNIARHFDITYSRIFFFVKAVQEHIKSVTLYVLSD